MLRTSQRYWPGNLAAISALPVQRLRLGVAGGDSRVEMNILLSVSIAL